MATKIDRVTFGKKELRGSRLRCLMVTTMPRKQVARCLTELIQPYGAVDAIRDHWMPLGFLKPDEAKLSEAPDFLSEKQRKALTPWWLKVTRNANTPNWDIVSTCKIEGQPGLILVEAKAHDKELKQEDKCSASNPDNLEQIGKSIQEANLGLNSILPGWGLSKNTHYQLCNRFAWSWKIATFGVPVILVYLGFLNAEEMVDQGKPFNSTDEWDDIIRSHASGIVPDRVWNMKLEINGTPMYALIRTVDLHWVPNGKRDRGGIWV
jgi:hypothetical protein